MKVRILLNCIMLSTALFLNHSFAQDNPRWNLDPSTFVFPTGSYVPLPQDMNAYVLPKTEPRTIVTNFGTFVVNVNVRPHPSNLNQQCECYFARSPINQLFMIVANQPIRNTNNYINAGIYFTTDGGLTWNGSDTLPAPASNDQRGDPGPTIDKNGRIIYTHLTSNTNFGGLRGMGANYSTDGGLSYSATFDIEVFSGVDKNLACTDDVPSSPFYGNSYMAYTHLVTSDNGYAARTTNGGVSWQPPVQLTSISTSEFAQGHDCKVGANGDVYVIFTKALLVSPFTEDSVGFVKSTNGGVTYSVGPNAYNCNGSRSASFNGWGIRTNGFPRIDVDKSGGPRNGWIYIVTDEINQAPAGSDADVILHYSSNGGTTWSAGIRVNQDALNNGKVQFFPAVRADEYGGVNVIYYDNRNFPPSGDSCSVFVSRSIDGGTTWTDIEIADHHFRPKLLPGINTMGDYIGITSGNNKIWGCWMDDKTGFAGVQFNIWVGSIDLGPSIDHTPLGNTSQTSGTRAVNCVINPAGSPIQPAATKLLYSRNNPVMTDSVLLTSTGGNNWTANINMSGAGLYRYYLTTTDSLGRTATSPPGAPGTTHQFTATALFTQCSTNLTPIRDFTTTYDSIFVNALGTITDVNFRMDSLMHTFDGDVSFWIRSPAGTEVTLAAQRGGGGQNYIMTLFNDSAATPISAGSPPFTGSFRPETPLNVFNGQNLFGFWRLRVNDNAGTDTGSVRRWCLLIETSGFLISVSNNQTPVKFELAQNYPNPFNPSTHIKYAVPKQLLVRIIVYDILGREVTTLVNELKQAGNYTVDFDGSRYSSGVYFYRLEAGDFVNVKKMVLMK
jgi:subtilisin-like proprotein convertase family protein